MESRHGTFGVLFRSTPLWSLPLKLALLAAAVVAVLAFAFAALVVVLPLALAAGVAFHLYVRRKLRQAARHRGASGDLVIEAEYTVIDRTPGDPSGSAPFPPREDKRLP